MTNYDTFTPIIRSPKYMSPERRESVSEMLQTYDSTKRLKTPPVEYRSSNLGMVKPRTANTAYSKNRRLISTASTKISRNSDNLIRLQKTGWSDRIGLPISTYNEKVFPRYRILFEHL